MLKYKWCVCDMDGTLLNSKEVISEENEAALKKLQKNGVEVIIASGRIDLLMKSFIKQLNLEGNIICCNGGLIKNITTGEIVYSKTIDKNIVKEIILYCFKNDIGFLVYTNNMVYSSKKNYKVENYENINKSVPPSLQIPIEYIDNSTVEYLEKADVFKVLLISDTEGVKLLKDYFSKYKSLTAVSSLDCLLDIMASNICKGSALKILSKKFRMDLDKVIVFGDNYNDLEMFECAGMPIAMGNAVEAIKMKAKYVTKSNNESGIAYAINNFILNK
ncbi:Cof-type HAD-IIB family hydrolase [Clostridium coskatii]|uniref:Phosphatase n=1 Tax=Clostridium coskatii TaxID=1705578 RepID=A0A162J7A8_9CLOT|nr:Cof-type HAD-IIB family hydrolase [Clostridium coskatii]OAA91355.1 putative phosphatase [Clostridium coskatii]OBR93987.1 putative phosphatase [Clostridium coskatii]